MAIKFCNHCKQPFQEGYYFENLDVEYFCSDSCLITAYPYLKDEAKREEMYDEDTFYFTEWHSLEPKLNLIEVYTHENTDSLWIYEDDAALNWLHNGTHAPLQSKWILVSEEEENALYELQKVENNTSTYYLTHEPFIHTENRTFNTLELAKSAYLEEEEDIWD